MKTLLTAAVCSLLIFSFVQEKKEPVCVMKTNYGTMIFKFFEKDAPNHCKQFQKLVNDGFYNGKDFYRVVKGFVMQAGGGDAPKMNAEFNKNPHLRGTLSMGRTGDVNSADSEIFICFVAIPRLDEKYTVFGQLIEGDSVLTKVENVEVKEVFYGTMAMHKPKTPVVIEKAVIEQRAIKQ